MSEKEKYLEMWKDAINRASVAIKNGDSSMIDQCHHEMEDYYQKYKEASDYENQMMDAKFATLNTMIENALPKLMVKNKKALKECMFLIKEDKNLSSQFKFCNALRKFNCDSDAVDYINESLNLVSKGIDKKTLKESNRKLAKLLVKYNIKPTNDINESDLKFAKDCDYVLTHKKTLNNLTEYTNHITNINNYIVENKKNNTDKIDVLSLAEKVEKKLNSLNEAEQSFVAELFSKGKEGKKEKLFNNMRNECIKTINKLVEENDGDEKERLLNMKETIMMKEFNPETIVEDIAKLLEIGSILSEN